jgi:hypothetical protein
VFPWLEQKLIRLEAVVLCSGCNKSGGWEVIVIITAHIFNVE